MLLLSCFARSRQRRWPPFLTNVRCISANSFLPPSSGRSSVQLPWRRGSPQPSILSRFLRFIFSSCTVSSRRCSCSYSVAENLRSNATRRFLDRVDIINGVLLVGSVFAVIPQMLLFVVAEETVYECGTDSIFTDPQYVLHVLVFALLIVLPNQLFVFLYVCLRFYVRYRARTTSVSTPVLVQPHVLAQPNADKRRSRNKVFRMSPLSDKNNGSELK